MQIDAASERIGATYAALGIVADEAKLVLARLGCDDAEVASALLRRGLPIRAGSEFGLPGYAPITVGPEHVMERVGAELGALLPE